MPLFGVNEDFALPLMTPRRLVYPNTKTVPTVTGKTVLVTGAGGSIGSELVRQIAASSPKNLYLLDHSEENMYEIMCVLEDSKVEFEYVGFLSDLRDEKLVSVLNEQISTLDVVFHAAALKHVPLLQTPFNLTEALRTNVLGTYHLLKLIRLYPRATFVQVSTDKAVNPMSFMGLTKRIAELLVQSEACSNVMNSYVVTRFGNVLGSSGSVIPRFRRQIAQGGPVTITDPEMVRYFMTINQAVKLVLKAPTKAEINRATICVLDMGEPVKILTLAESLIREVGLEPNDDVEIVYTGVRPGEKLYEELSYPFEKLLHARDGMKIYTCENAWCSYAFEALDATRARNFEKVMSIIERENPKWPIFQKE